MLDFWNIFIFVVGLALMLWVYFMFFFRKTVKISLERKKFYEKKIKQACHQNNSPTEQILEIDKLYHHLLKELWYYESFGDILKKKPTEIRDLDHIWQLHKMRNKLAHELDHIAETKLKKYARDYKKAFEGLLKSIS